MTLSARDLEAAQQAQEQAERRKAQLEAQQPSKPRRTGAEYGSALEALATGEGVQSVTHFDPYVMDPQPDPEHEAATRKLTPRRAEYHPVSVDLSDVQKTADDLYRRGLNVFPIPSVYEWRKADPTGTKKPPYIVRPLFYNRMHHSERVDFTYLFERANIAVMTGRTSGNLLSVDCDSPEAFEMIGRKLGTLPYWAITSHRGGAYFLRLIEGEAANQSEGETPFENVQVWGNCHYQVIPPSIHPAGTVYQWATAEPRQHLPKGRGIDPVSVSDLEFLGVTLAAQKSGKKWQAPELYGLPEWGAQLSRKNREVYAYGANDGSRNSQLTNLAYDLAGCEIEYSEAVIYFMTAAGRCTPAHSEKEARAILKSAYSQPRNPARKGGKMAVKPWQKAEQLAQSFDWRATFGRRAITRKGVYLACIERARLDHSEVFRASIREISELANIHTQATTTALRDLLTAGLIRFVGINPYTGANLYAFVLDYSQFTTVIPLAVNSVVNWEYPKTQVEQDIFGKLGVRAWQVWRYLLLEGPQTTRYQIAKKTGLHPSSVYQAIANLIGARLVKYSPAEGLLYADSKTEAGLQELALDLGVYGKTERKAQGYQVEREKRVNQLVARAIDKFRRKL